MTYTSIAILVILGDDLTRLDRKAIIDGELKSFEEQQKPNRISTGSKDNSIDDF